jgi:hypothetical protein
MKNLFLLLFCAPLLFGQSSHPEAVSRILLADPGIATGKPTFFIPPRFLTDPSFAFPGSVDNGGFLSGRSLLGSADKVDLTSPLRLQWAREEKLGTLRSILGSMTFGGAAFLAVKSLQKKDSKPPLPRQIRTNKP